MSDFITVYRSADMNARQDATAVRDKLASQGVNAQLAGDMAPGVVDGTWEVRVPAAEASLAESIVGSMNQDDPGLVNPSRELDTVPLIHTQGATGEMEAMAIQSILDANGIPAVLVGASTLPNLSFQVRVAKADVERAQATLAEARAAGPAAALEAEQESERQQS